MGRKGEKKVWGRPGYPGMKGDADVHEILYREKDGRVWVGNDCHDLLMCCESSLQIVQNVQLLTAYSLRWLLHFCPFLSFQGDVSRSFLNISF